MGVNLIIGLGNPGSEYENTYHNVGRTALEYWLGKKDPEATFRSHGDYFEYAEASGTIFVRPLVFMNESGLAARAAIRMFNVQPETMMIMHDESDMSVGNYKVSLGGSSAGHKGVQSIIDHIHVDNFWRARIGIRDPRERARKKAGDFVLNRVSSDQKKILTDVFSKIIAQVE